jgi:MoaA/NifB/PqqE/SkfB family radical SAM enzyme
MTSSHALLEKAAFKATSWGTWGLTHVPPLRRAVVRAWQRHLLASAASPDGRAPRAVAEDKIAMGLAMVRVAERALAEGRLTTASARALFGPLIHDSIVQGADRGPKKAFRDRHGSSPPDFLTISPTRTCNLTCVGCYASSSPTPEKLDWMTLERIVTEAHERWGTRFFVLSGGEPFAYRDQGKGVLDLAERHPDCFFLMYTNGTLVDDRVARRLGELGNLSPGISVEGLREPTDARRGRGVFDKVLAAMERLRRENVLFGLSLTATRENCEQILSDELVETLFDRMGALYAWVFHYMPIGRGPSLDLMMTPEQRLRLWERVWSLVRDRRLFIVDFWNSGAASHGCLAAARAGGYLYVDWNGAVCPCVFVPYSPVNIHDVFARGGSLDDVWREPFFAGIRSWQREYGYRECGEHYEGTGNWLMPCIFRDHHARFQGLVAQHRPEPADESARTADADPDYHRRLVAFGRDLARLTDPIWQSRYGASAGEAAPPAASPASDRRRDLAAT